MIQKAINRKNTILDCCTHETICEYIKLNECFLLSVGVTKLEKWFISNWLIS